MTSEKDETVWLSKGSLENVMWDHLRKECGTIQRENECPFTGVSRNGGRHWEVFHSAWFWLGSFFQFVGVLCHSSCLIGITLCMLFVTLPFTFQLVVSNALHGHAGKCPINVTCNCHLVVHFAKVDGNCLCVSAQLEAPGAEWLESHTSRDVWVLKGIAWVKTLQAHHDTGHAFLI